MATRATASTAGDRRSDGKPQLLGIEQQLHPVIVPLSTSTYQPKGARAWVGLVLVDALGAGVSSIRVSMQNEALLESP